jgi:hypothetical protein
MDNGPVDQPVDVIQAITQHRDADGDRQCRDDRGYEQFPGCVTQSGADSTGRRQQQQQRRAIGEPLQLLAFGTCCPAEPHNQRDRAARITTKRTELAVL